MTIVLRVGERWATVDIPVEQALALPPDEFIRRHLLPAVAAIWAAAKQ